MSLRRKLSSVVDRAVERAVDRADDARDRVRNTLREVVTAARAPSSSAPLPAPAESQVVLRDGEAGPVSSTPVPAAPRVRAVEHVERLPPETFTATQQVAYDWDYAAK